LNQVEQEHFFRAALELGANGDNDTLPFDVDYRFIRDNADNLSKIAFSLFVKIDAMNEESARKYVDGLPVFSERLLVPTGSAGFRITTKIHHSGKETYSRVDPPSLRKSQELSLSSRRGAHSGFQSEGSVPESSPKS
jgi:hypothetical protein